MKTYELFESIARTTWRTIISAHRNRILFGEDAITSYNLHTLASAGPLNICFEDTRVDESTKGCDFELWVGSDATGWYRYAIQAKKIDVKTGRYKQLGHKVKGVLQLDILENYAKANDAIPLYCFYNYFEGDLPWNCNYINEEEQLGCTVAPSSVVSSALKKRGERSFTSIHKHRETLPWRCLVKCPKLTPSKNQTATSYSAPRLYEKLPSALQALRRERRENSQPYFNQDGLFNSDVNLFPHFISVVDISNLIDD
jgi:hypothetical protein